MEKLWSPWRSSYIESFKSKKEVETCIFCSNQKVETGNNSSLTVYEAEKTFITLNLYPYNSGHVMVIPKRHICEFGQLSGDEMTEIMAGIKLAVSALDKIMKPQGYNIGANIGKAAGAGIDAHLHFHVLPRWNGDTNFMPAIGEVKVISLDLSVTKQNLIKAFSELK